MFGAVIVAAGSSRRAGFDKLVAPLAGRPVLLHSVDAFVQAGCDCVVVVCPPERWAEVGLDTAVYPVPVLRVDGGEERQDSVCAGLQALPESAEWVAVHDGARPLITPADITACLAAARETGAAACAHPVVDTLKRVNASGFSLPEKVSRDNLWGMETPQIFRTELLRRAYAHVRAEKLCVTDEVSAVETLGVATRLVRGGANIKITHPGDLELAELLLNGRS